jgi:Uma2 family endonuclease
MSTAERTRPPRILPPLVAGERIDQPTFHERYEAMPPETRAELVGGIVYMPSPMRIDHGETGGILGGWMDRYVRFTPGVRHAEAATVKLDQQGEPQPDGFLFIPAELGGQSGVDEEGYLTGAPELVGEIARSSRRFDLNEKKADYERAGVQEYLVVELDPNRIHWFFRRANRFQKLRPGPDGIYRSKVFPGLWLDPAAIFAGDRARRDEVVEEGVRTPEHAAFVAKLARAMRKKRP